MLARAYIRAARTYVDPFDRICHGLRSLLAPATTDPKEVSGQFSRFNTPARTSYRPLCSVNAMLKD